MAFPGEGYKMSNYGFKSYTPEQSKEQWRESCVREGKVTNNHAAKKSEREKIKNLDTTEAGNYFNTKKSHEITSAYDSTFNAPEGYCSKLRRDDRQHAQGLDVLAEERDKDVPVLSSSVYGHRAALEAPDRQHVRVALVKREFYRSHNTNLSPGPL